MTSLRAYILAFSLTCAAIMGPVLFSFLGLWSAGEFRAVEVVAADQQHSEALYGSGVHGNEFEHRLALIGLRHPEIMALGSSRTLQFREEYFTRPFACACLVAHDLVGVDSFLDTLPQGQWPKLILLGIDYWWLLSDYGETPAPVHPRADSTPVSLAKLAQPAAWLAEGRLRLGDFLGLFRDDGGRAGSVPLPRVGVQAKVFARGYRRDGSLFDGHILSTTGLPLVKGFEHDLGSIRRSVAPWQHGAVVPERVEHLKRIIARIRAAGSDVIVILPPFPGAVLQAMEANPDYAVVAQVRQAILSLDAEAYDFTDGRELSGDCEYLDARHGGDVVYLRMLREILRRNPTSALAGYVDAAAIQAEIEVSRGRAFAYARGRMGAFEEVDFLGLGCRKERPAETGRHAP